MTRFVLRYTGTGTVPADDVERVRARARVVEVAGRTVLVDGSARQVGAVVADLEGWVAVPETMVPRAPTRPSLKAATAAGRARR